MKVTEQKAEGLKKKYQVELPICEAVDAIVNQGMSALAAGEALMERMGRQE